VVAGNPKVYGQLVQLLAPHTRVIADTAPPAEGEGEAITPAAALAAQAAPQASPAAPPPKAAVRVRKSGR
jgi:myo-inositol-1(or 4)-monophosphatase